MKNLIDKILLVIIIVIPLYSLTITIKYLTLQKEYNTFLTNTLEYDTAILAVVKELQGAGHIEEALAIARTAVRAEDINTWWHMNVFNWSNGTDQFLPVPSKYFDYWLQTGKLLFPGPEQNQIQGQSV